MNEEEFRRRKVRAVLVVTVGMVLVPAICVLVTVIITWLPSAAATESERHHEEQQQQQQQGFPAAATTTTQSTTTAIKLASGKITSSNYPEFYPPLEDQVTVEEIVAHFKRDPFFPKIFRNGNLKQRMEARSNSHLKDLMLNLKATGKQVAVMTMWRCPMVPSVKSSVGTKSQDLSLAVETP